MHALLRPFRPRRIASWMLWLWLAAAMVSGVNACIVPSVAAAPFSHGHTEGTPAGAVHHTPGSDTGPAQAVCASFCDAGQAITLAKQPLKDKSPDGPAAAAFVDAAWPARRLVRDAPGWRLTTDPPPRGIPVVIAFLRLVR